ncbi:methyltransferase domain-containing protein [Viridibacillus sp. YIM B01967]|uniref:Methyltransferase domain-containing protein n=1 Tax=Viridibacillus soli TaxID=2798301 RepID=A0ABS1H5Z8_9BACL|nr:methyltransferase domain-containing protein [Viridibacillus soli]MBK3494840.1 methyltransferase domain-containing protein [Viridibacillus soli]
MLKKYGKSLGDIFDIKKTFIESNNELLKDNIKLAKIAKKQPKRSECKNCSNELSREVLFTKQGIDYHLCETCNHLNSIYDDTNEFAKAVYVEEVTSYSKTYSAEDRRKWLSRVDKIYTPKAKFLGDFLLNTNKITINSVMDIGAGSGYFVKALLNEKFINVHGYEVSTTQVNFANKMLGQDLVEQIEMDSLVDIIANSEAEILTMIGVLEHLTNPREILKAISMNKNIKFYYISLPLFSYSVFWEILNENIFNRHLYGGHTHLYTKESINYFCKEFDFTSLAEWQFGVDAMDLYRFSLIQMKSKNVSKKMIDLFSEKFVDVIDDIQLTFDKSEFSSEIHLILKNN